VNRNRATRVGIIGYGFMGRTHALAYQRAARDGFACELVAVADRSVASLGEGAGAGNLKTGGDAIDHSGVTLHRGAQDLLADESIDLVSICTHTDTHVPLALAALDAGKHVLVEKPVAIEVDQVERLADAARATDRLCLPAMCMRYWPAWVKIHAMIGDERYGAVRSAAFHRLGTRPNWAGEFYADETRSGGVLCDLHIHDTDFLVHCFGAPERVMTSGDAMHLSSLYHYGADGPVHMIAEGAWDHQPGAGFQMRCTVVCERATIDFNIGREEQLVVYQGDARSVVEVGGLTGYDGQVRAMLDAIGGDESGVRATMEDAVMTARVLKSERVSMDSGRPCRVG